MAAIFVLSGFAALVYQVAWQRALFTIYGVDVESVTVVVTAFMLGLGLGSLAGGRVADRQRLDHLGCFAAIEALVCAYGLGSLALFTWVGGLTGPGGAGGVFAATFALVLVPTALMGATLPLLAAHAARNSGNVGHSLAVFYFANTIGGAVAAIATAIFLLRYIGLQSSVVVAAALNFAVMALAVSARRLSRFQRRKAMARSHSRERVQAVRASDLPTRTLGRARAPASSLISRPIATAALCSATVGFVSLSWEILWYRVYSFATGGTISVFGLFLGIYLAGMAVGAFLARHACGALHPKALDKIARGAALAALVGGVVGYFHSPLVGLASQYAWSVAPMVVAGVSAGLYGAVLPLLAHYAVPPDDRAGRGISYVYLANILGSALGSALTGFLFLEVLGTATTSVLLLAVSAALAVALRYGIGTRPARRQAAFAAIALLAFACLAATSGPLYDTLYERLLWKTPDAEEHPFRDLVETRAGVVAITAKGTVYGGGVYDGRLNISLDTDTNMIYRAYALAGLHPGPRRVAMLGLGSGSWAQVVAHLPSVEELVIVEINHGYVDLLRRHELVRGLLTNPAVTIVIDDGRRWLETVRGERYDLIVVNTSFHWRANATHLLSAEYFALVTERLALGGVLYFNTTHSDEAMRTACTAFASGLRLGSFVAVGNGDVQLDLNAYETAVRSLSVEGRPATADADEWIAGRLPHWLSAENYESCAQILARTVGKTLVTDDNLATEAAVPWYATYRTGPPE